MGRNGQLKFPKSNSPDQPLVELTVTPGLGLMTPVIVLQTMRHLEEIHGITVYLETTEDSDARMHCKLWDHKPENGSIAGADDLEVLV